MESIIIKENIIVYYLEATSFPEGIGHAFQELFGTIKPGEEKAVFGISRPENGKILYKVATELKSAGDAAKHNLPSMVIEAGQYIGILVKNFRDDINSIGNAFMKLTSQPNIDPNGYCIEWYQGAQDVLCLVKLKL